MSPPGLLIPAVGVLPEAKALYESGLVAVSVLSWAEAAGVNTLEVIV